MSKASERQLGEDRKHNRLIARLSAELEAGVYQGGARWTEPLEGPPRPKPYVHNGTYVCTEAYIPDVILIKSDGKNGGSV